VTHKTSNLCVAAHDSIRPQDAVAESQHGLWRPTVASKVPTKRNLFYRRARMTMRLVELTRIERATS
jgi:hypothetical protein